MSRQSAMSRQRAMYRPRFSVFCGLLMAVAFFRSCSYPLPVQSPTAEPTGEVCGRAEPWGTNSPISGRRLVLCQSLGDPREGNCILMREAVTTDEEGNFDFGQVPCGTYFVLYDSGLSDFDAALVKWGGETLHFGDTAWMESFLGVDFDKAWLAFHVPEGVSISPHDNWLQTYCLATLLAGDSPFIIAHDIEKASKEQVLRCLLVVLDEGEVEEITVQMAHFDTTEG